jgi:hypothetical protein
MSGHKVASPNLKRDFTHYWDAVLWLIPLPGVGVGAKVLKAVYKVLSKTRAGKAAINRAGKTNVVKWVKQKLAKGGKQKSEANKTSEKNKLNHIFGKKQHNLGGFLKSYGGNQSKAYNALNKATQKYVEKNKVKGVFTKTIKVKSYKITVRGKVVNGKAKIGTAYIP